MRITRAHLGAAGPPAGQWGAGGRAGHSLADQAMPNLFLVGAPKCGTTAVWAWLRSHPAVFMATLKEPHFFGSDLRGRWFVRDPACYAALFAEAHAPGVPLAGEASVFYLYSRLAAAEIKRASPEARIVAIVRDPVTAMHALHAQLYYNGNEDIADFGAALAAESERRRTRQSPNDNYPPEVLWYREVVRFAEQLERYLEAFGPDRVHVIVHDDLIARREDTLQALLRFLDLDATGVVGMRRANSSKLVRSRRVHAWVLRPSPGLRRLARAALPQGIRRGVIRLLLAANTLAAPRRPLDPALQRALRLELAPDTEQLGRLLRRDLSDWTRDDG